MKLLNTLFLSLLATCLLACGGSTNSPKFKGPTLRLNLYTEPPTLDPRKAADTTSSTVLRMTFEGLMRIGQSGIAQPGIAQSIIISEDKKKYTFMLRKSRWTDGNPLTAHDFVYAWKKVLDPLFVSDYAYQMYVIKNAAEVKKGRLPSRDLGVRVLDDYTLEVELENPTPYFLELMAFTTFYPIPRHIDQKDSKWAYNAGKNYVSNGPFKLVWWDHNERLDVVKNADYWDHEKVKLNHIELSIISDTNTELSMFENDELDWAGGPISRLPLDAIPHLKKQGLLQTYPIAGVEQYKFNTGRPPFNNAKLRKAFAYALNRQSIVDNITQTGQIPAREFVPPSMKKKSTPFYNDADLSKAKKLFESALVDLGLTRETFPEVSLSYNTSEGHEKIAQAIQQQWQKAFGVQVVLDNSEWKVYLDKVHKRKYGIARMGWVADFHDGMNFLEMYKYRNDPNSGGNNDTYWSNPNYTKFLDKANTVSKKERAHLLHSAERILMDEMPIIPIYFYSVSYLKKDRVKDVYLSPLGAIDFKWARVE